MSCAAMGNRSDTAQVKLRVLADETSEISKQTRAPRSPSCVRKEKKRAEALTATRSLAAHAPIAAATSSSSRQRWSLSELEAKLCEISKARILHFHKGLWWPAQFIIHLVSHRFR